MTVKRWAVAAVAVILGCWGVILAGAPGAGALSPSTGASFVISPIPDLRNGSALAQASWTSFPAGISVVIVQCNTPTISESNVLSHCTFQGGGGNTGSQSIHVDMAVSGHDCRYTNSCWLIAASDDAEVPTQRAYALSPNGPNVGDPIAAAGYDVQVASGHTFALEGGLHSTGPSAPLTFQWTQISGPVAKIEDDHAADTNVSGVRGPGTLRFRLKVTGGDGRSNTDDVVITVAAAPK